MQAETGLRSRRGLWAINTVGAIVMVFVFILMVMTAIAQQEVIGRIQAEQLDLSYGATLSVHGAANNG